MKLIEYSLDTKVASLLRNGDSIVIEKSSSVKDPSIVIKEMADDNSCLFNAVSYVVSGGKTGPQATELRELVAGLVLSGAAGFDAATLGRSPDEYATWIQRPNSWGGAIELALLATQYETEIASIDVATGRIDIFGQERAYTKRVYLLYGGIHYDALALMHGDGTEQTAFSSFDDTVLGMVLDLADRARMEHRYTDTARFTLRCDHCRAALRGEQEAEQHAVSTGHQAFSEYQ